MRARLLMPGALVFEATGTCWQTVLGPCVALTFWHARLRLGAMCHCLLPARPQRPTGPQRLDGRYVDEALAWIQQRMRRYDARPSSYEVGVFGGGMVSAEDPSMIGQRNVEAARRLLRANGWVVWREDVLGVGNRQLSFELSSGLVSVQFHALGL